MPLYVLEKTTLLMMQAINAKVKTLKLLNFYQIIHMMLHMTIISNFIIPFFYRCPGFETTNNKNE